MCVVAIRCNENCSGAINALSSHQFRQSFHLYLLLLSTHLIVLSSGHLTLCPFSLAQSHCHSTALSLLLELCSSTLSPQLIIVSLHGDIVDCHVGRCNNAHFSTVTTEMMCVCVHVRVIRVIRVIVFTCSL